jgi:predicted acyl esterase
VILAIGPYFNHSGQLGLVGAVELEPFNPATVDGPSTRFYDLSTGGDIFRKGYTFVQVDLRDFGGSNGCLDWVGPGEQADVKAAVEWAARQPWSTGKVGMYGKSYDGVTGLVAENISPKGLAAVVAQEPVYDMYRYLYTNRVRFVNSLATPMLYNGIAGTPGTASDTLAYNSNAVNDTSRPGCPAFNYADQQDENRDSPYWRFRNLIAGAKKGKTPLFMTQGFIEPNTKPDGAFDYFNAVKAPKRGWFGQFEHVRGNDRDENGRLRMGRKGWFNEVMRFYDRHLKGLPAKSTTARDPKLAVQSSDGKWRAESSWPPKDASRLTAKLNGGTYTDHGQNNGTNYGPPYGDGIWTFSKPLKHLAHFMGKPRLTVETSAPIDRGNLVVNIHDVAPNGDATLISRSAYLLNAGTTKASFDLYPNDWRIRRGHRIGVLVTSSNAEWWAHVPTGQQVAVKRASVSMSFATCARPKTIQGASSIFLEEYLEVEPIPVDAETIAAGERAGFPLPAKLQDCKPKKTDCSKEPKLRFRIGQPWKGRIVEVRAYVDGKLVRRKRGRRVTRLVLDKPKNKTKFTVRVVAIADDGQKTISVRRYGKCFKSSPVTHVVQPGR